MPVIEVMENGQRVLIYAPPKELLLTGQGILNFDELNQGDPTLMAVAQRILLDRQIGDCKIGDGWYITAMGNRAEHRAAVFQMPDPVKNRLTHLYVEPNLGEWKQHVLEHGLNGLPIRSEILGYLNFASHDFAPSIEDTKMSTDAKPTPRSWGMLNAWMHADMMELAPGTVGQGVGASFLSFCEIAQDLPSIDAILSGEKVKPISSGKDVSVLYATVSSLSVRITSGNLPENITASAALVSAMEWVLTNETKPTEFMTLLSSEVLRNATFRKTHSGAFIAAVLKSSALKAKLNEIREYMS